MGRNQRGQSTAEYAIVIGVVIAAIVGMQIYLKRGMQAKFRDVSDYMTQHGGAMANDPNTATIGTTKQYEPYYTSAGTMTISENRDVNEDFKKGGMVDRTITKDDTLRTGSSTSGVDLTADVGWN